MPSLAETQDRLRQAIVQGADTDLAIMAGSAARTRSRLAVHVRHFRRSLTRVVERTFPAVVSLVDPRFFGYCADAYIDARPPTRPCLFEYGSNFPDFLGSFEPCASLPYLPDVARLEWDMHAVFHYLTADPTAPARWLARSVRLLSSPYPIERIWQVAHGGDSIVDLSAGGSRLVIYTDGDQVSFETLSPGACVFLSELRVSRRRERALMAARAIEPAFNVRHAIPAAVADLLHIQPEPEYGVQANVLNH